MEAFESTDPDTYDRNFLRHVCDTRNYDLLRERIDYLPRQFARDKDFVYDLYLDLLLTGEKEIGHLIGMKCSISHYSLLNRAVKRKIKLSELRLKFDQYEIRHYFIILVETDCLELYLEQEAMLCSVLTERELLLLVVESSSSRITHHLCKQGRHKEILDEYMRHGENLKETQHELLSSICNQYFTVEFLTLRFMDQASNHNAYLCKLLLCLGAKPNEEQRQMLFRQAPSFHKKLFAEDV